jgi:alpha-1,3-rhamnosyl/mannosyltransferase
MTVPPATPSSTPQAPSTPAGSGVDVAVNLLWCIPGEVGGSEQYLVRQLIGLAAQPAEFVPTVYCLPEFVDAHPELGPLYRLVSADISGAHRSRRIVAEHTWLRRRTRGAELVHHGGGTAPLVGSHPFVLTVHDLQHLTHPEYVRGAKRRYLDAMIPRSVRRATVVAVPTEYVKSTVVDAYGTDPDRIVVVPHGVEPGLGATAPSEFDLRRRYGLGGGPILVLPAITHPHKGHRFLLEVMARHWTDPDLRLVLLGGAGTAEAKVDADIERLGLRPRVVRPGRVSDADRDGLISLATALVFPSEYEGFGAPVVEAMALGTPVVCSDQPALAEVVAGAGLVLPRDVEAWGDALDEVARRRNELRTAGRRRAAEFTTERSGAALASAYRLAVERS